MVAVSLFWADLHGGFLDEKHGKKELKHPDNLLRRSSYLGVFSLDSLKYDITMDLNPRF